MSIGSVDINVLNRFDFELPPVGVKYFIQRPDMVDRLDEKTTLCQMLGWAQQGRVFYADPDNHTCEAGSYVLGQTGVKEAYRNGEYGAGLQVFESPRSAARLYEHIPTIARGVVKYVGFAPLDKLPFEPDLLVVLADVSQAEILLRAMSYVTGEMWFSRYTAAIGCSWIFVYPYLHGQINYVTTGLGFGMRRRKIFPEGRELISIPFDRLPFLLQTLEVMPWVPEPYKADGAEYAKNLRIRLGLEKPE